ncbi:unnamed protein product [Cylindrotheca closterium]|uniref:Uncharacterized protein n=1 Tax=Cylindrotheca closterium TaxID=2856 RepID=A0AAD2FFE6_9STRA|nr:unnamed protein product [Cylindrotheca closterium]CAJ1934730.1 unnamed protein product [Cylindrotheca closterium]
MLRSKAGQEGCDVYIPPLTYIYTDGVALPQGPVDFPTTTSILIFNAAIANHLFARVQGRKEASLRYLRKAKKLYVLAHEGQENSDVNFLFHIAIINNLAMVDLAIGDLESAHKSFEYMVSLMMLQLDQGYDLSSHLHDFLSNIPIAIKAAPAA